MRDKKNWKRLLAFTISAAMLAPAQVGYAAELGIEAYAGSKADENGFVIENGVLESYIDYTAAEIVIPDVVTSIGNSAFREHTKLTSVTIPDSVTSIGDEAFRYCNGLTSMTIPDSVTSIGDRAFYSCYGLTSLTISSSVTSIGYSAFGNCSGLTSLTIPSSVTSIEGLAFSGCYGLTSIIVEEGNTKYDSRDNCNAIIETESNRLLSGCKKTTIPSSVTSIGSYTF